MHLDNQQDEQCSSYNYSLNIIELIQLLCSNAIIQCREELWKKECNAYIKRWNDNFELHSNSIVFPLKLHIKCTKTKYAQIHPEGNTIRKYAGRQGVTTNTTNMQGPLGSGEPTLQDSLTLPSILPTAKRAADLRTHLWQILTNTRNQIPP